MKGNDYSTFRLTFTSIQPRMLTNQCSSGANLFKCLAVAPLEQELTQRPLGAFISKF